MTGETHQPGGRAAAPGRLALVQAFLNTHYDLRVDHGAEVLHSPAALREWLLRHDLVPAETGAMDADLARAIRIREALRSLAAENSTPGRGAPAALAQLNRAAKGSAVELRFTAAGPDFAAGAGIPGALGLLLALAAGAMMADSWRRLKVCPGTHCGWAFFDRSRNLSGRWCSMSLCGGRSKANSSYRRKRGGG